MFMGSMRGLWAKLPCLWAEEVKVSMVSGKVEPGMRAVPDCRLCPTTGSPKRDITVHPDRDVLYIIMRVSLMRLDTAFGV